MAQKAKKKSKLRHAEYYDMQKTFDSLYADSKSGEVFGHLMDIISAPSNIKLALFLIMSDTDSTFNFVIAMLQSQLFNLLCDKADDEYGGKLPVHVRCLLDEFANSVTRSTPKTVGITDKSVA